MNSMKRMGLLAGAAALTLTGAGFAETSLQEQNTDLKTRIAELEKRLDAVESQDGSNWLTEQRAQEIKGLVQEVLADADTRSSMLAQGMTAGYDNGAVLSSADGNWLLRTNILIQTRFDIRTQTGGVFPGFPTNTDQWGFEVTRAKFMLSGHVVSPEWFYQLDIETSPNATASVAENTTNTAAGLVGKTDARAGLTTAYIGYDFGNGWKVMGGNMKTPLVREDMMGAQYQQAVERSVLTYLYTGGYTSGIAVDYMGDVFHVIGVYSNGYDDGLYGGTIGFTNNSPALFADTDLAFTMRGEWLASGTWDQFKDYTSPQGEEMGVLVGGAIHYQNSQNPAVADTKFFTFTMDCSAEFGGGNVYGAIFYSAVNPAAAPSAHPWGFQVGGGWYLDPTWELFGRYEFGNSDSITPNDLSIITFGVNKYFASHNAKWTTDVGWGLDSVDYAVGVTGWNIDTPGQDGQFVLRSQVQILF